MSKPANWTEILNAKHSGLSQWMARGVLAKFSPDMSYTELSKLTKLSGSTIHRYAHGGKGFASSIQQLGAVLGDTEGGLIACGYHAQTTPGDTPSYHVELIAAFKQLVAYSDVLRLDEADQKYIREDIERCLGHKKYKFV